MPPLNIKKKVPDIQNPPVYPGKYLGVDESRIPKDNAAAREFNSYIGLFPQAGGRYRGVFGLGDKKEEYTPTGSNRTFTITQDMIHSFSAGRKIFGKLFPKGADPWMYETSKPITQRELLTLQTGDTTYPERSIKHLRSIPSAYYAASGLTP